FPVPLYFVAGGGVDGGVELLPQGNTVAANLHFLGTCGVKTLEDLGGLRVAFLSGTEQGKAEAAGAESTARPWQFGDVDVQALMQVGSDMQDGGSLTKVDVLLSAEWPRQILHGLDITQFPVVAVGPEFSDSVRKISMALAPRYHFAGLEGTFYQRIPFENGLFKVDGLFTRFIGLGSVDPANKDKTKKWLHALALEPLSAQSDDAIRKSMPEIGANPFAMSQANPANGSSDANATALMSTTGEDGPLRSGSSALSAEQVAQLVAEDRKNASQFFYGARGNKRKDGRRGGPGRKRRRHNVAPRADCWFCLASPSCETHLIVSVADDCFLSLPKGGISAQHLQIVPVAHEECFAALDEGTLEQVIKFKAAITEFYKTFGCVALFFERNVILERAMQRHAFLEAIPLPESCVATAEKTLQEQSERAGIRFDTELPLASTGTFATLSAKAQEDGIASLKAYLANSEDEYMYIEISGGAVSPRIFRLPPISSDDVDGSEPGDTNDMAARFAKRQRLPLQFGRQVACCILGCLQRINWKFCQVPQDLEERMTTDMKAAFKALDPFRDEEDDDQKGDAD
ncbi:CWF19-like protein 1, partial [Durusdinium trenchii]